ncbi:MAG: hypothetical protein ACOX8T_11630, partial [Bacillota bacterium]
MGTDGPTVKSLAGIAHAMAEHAPLGDGRLGRDDRVRWRLCAGLVGADAEILADGWHGESDELVEVTPHATFLGIRRQRRLQPARGGGDVQAACADHDQTITISHAGTGTGHPPPGSCACAPCPTKLCQSGLDARTHVRPARRRRVQYAAGHHQRPGELCRQAVAGRDQCGGDAWATNQL